MAGENGTPYWPEELITREQALTALTINCAKQMFIEDERGGKFPPILWAQTEKKPSLFNIF